MWPYQELDLHHSDPEAKKRHEPGDMLVHRRCNKIDGGRYGAKIMHANQQQVADACMGHPALRLIPDHCPYVGVDNRQAAETASFAYPRDHILVKGTPEIRAHLSHCPRLHAELCSRCSAVVNWACCTAAT